MKITENDNTITATETLKLEDFSLTIEEAYEKMAETMMDTIVVPCKEKNDFLYNCFSDIFMDKETKTIVKADFTNAMTKYMSFYNFIKHLVKNGNLDESVVREKIKEMEKEIENERN